MRAVKKHGSFGIFVNICEGVLAGRNCSGNVAELYIHQIKQLITNIL